MRVRATLSTQSAARLGEARGSCRSRWPRRTCSARRRRSAGSKARWCCGRPSRASPPIPTTASTIRCWPRKATTSRSATEVTDDEGKAVFKLDLAKYAKATYQLSFLARAFEPGSGRNVAAQASTLVSANDFLVGIKARRWPGLRQARRRRAACSCWRSAGRQAARGRRPACRGGREALRVGADAPGLGPVPLRLAGTALPDCSDSVIALAAGGQSVPLPTGKPGNFVLEVRAADGTVLNQVEYSVAGAANLSRSLERNAELTLALSKPGYKPGETIEVSVRAPYAGSGLITIERDQRLCARLVPRRHHQLGAEDPGAGRLRGQRLRQRAVPARPGLRRNVHEPAVVRRGAVRGGPRRAHAAAVACSCRRWSSPAADPGAISRPRARRGCWCSRWTRASCRSRAIASAIRSTIFFTKKMLQVSTAQILDLLLPEFSRLAATGGARRRRQRRPGARTSIRSSASRRSRRSGGPGIVDVDGRRQLKFRLPDHFNGRVRVTAVAVTPARIGHRRNAGDRARRFRADADRAHARGAGRRVRAAGRRRQHDRRREGAERR